ncbi:MAG: hypothetical protein WCQ16_07715 [Verrucomicrobiae bacterium]
MVRQGSCYFWKWADNDLPGKPAEVFADLMLGEWLQVEARIFLRDY